MSKLEELRPNASVQGILPNCLVSVINAQWFGSEALELTYKDPTGKVGNELLYRHDEQRFKVVEEGRPWSLDGAGALFRLVAEAQRIRLAHLFDPVLAVHTSVVDPLPHQITAVYDAMLPRQPLRFLLADDPGAGKTIMAGLLMKELIARGDLLRCLVVCPGSLAEPWQDELWRRFHLPFEILTNDKLEAARTGNWFFENHLVIARLDKLSRDADVQVKLEAPDCRWDLVVVDEAHKMSATFFGGEIKYTKRYRLGQLLSGLARHYLLMTATPHNAKEEDFQLFMGIGPHPKGIHHWWARLPLPVARAVLFTSVVDDPESHPEKFPTEEAQNAERERLFGILRELMEKRLHEAPEAYVKAQTEMLKHCDGRLPALFDPFAGGGSIPLEGNRMGFEAHAGD
jgi:superfamily II DNA or RNA helicase